MLRLALFGLACTVALLVALPAKRDGHVLRVAALILWGNWLMFAMPWIYAPAAPAFVVRSSNLNIWALTDLLSMVAIGWAGWRVWWSPAVWSLYLVTLSMFAIAYATGLPYEQYMYVLDGALIVQLAVVLTIGGGDCADYLSDFWRAVRLRLLGGTSVVHRLETAR